MSSSLLLEEVNQQAQAPDDLLTEEGLEIAITDLLQDSFVKTSDELTEHERKLQSIYKYSPYYLGIQSKIREAALLGALIERGDVILCSTCHQPYRIGEWPLCGVGYGREHTRVLARNAQSDTVTSYFINQQTGKVWIPGKNNRIPIDRTGKPIAGYVQHQVRNYRERDSFYKLMDNIAKKEYFSKLRKEEAAFAPLFKENRSNLRAEMNRVDGMSPEAHPGKAWAEHAINKTEQAQKDKLNYSPNTYLDGWEFDANNQGAEDGSYKKVVESIKKMQPELSKKHKEAIGKLPRKSKVA